MVSVETRAYSSPHSDPSPIDGHFPVSWVTVCGALYARACRIRLERPGRPALFSEDPRKAKRCWACSSRTVSILALRLHTRPPLVPLLHPFPASSLLHPPRPRGEKDTS